MNFIDRAAPPPPNPLLAGPFMDTRSGPLNSKAQLLVGPVTAFYILAIVAIGLRVWSKNIKKTNLRFNDYAIFVAAFFATCYLAICWLVVERGGVGFPLIKVRPSERKLTQQSFISAWIIQAWGNTFVRLSILDFFAHVFRVSKFPIIVYVFEGFTVAYLVGCTITFFAICRPMKYNWEIGPLSDQHCGNFNLKFLLSSVFNLALDCCILVLPLPMLWTLKLNARKKAALTFVFGLGIFVCFATAWRTYHVVEFSKPESKKNFTVTVIDDALWSGLEITLGIINACMPVIQPALQKIFGSAPFIGLLSLTTRGTWGRSAKSSKMSSTDRSHASAGDFKSGTSWRKIDDTQKSFGDSIMSKHGITQEHTIDIEAGSVDGMLIEMRQGATTWASEPKR